MFLIPFKVNAAEIGTQSQQLTLIEYYMLYQTLPQERIETLTPADTVQDVIEFINSPQETVPPVTETITFDDLVSQLHESEALIAGTTVEPVIELEPVLTPEPVVITPVASEINIAVTVANDITPVADPSLAVADEEVKNLAKVIYAESRGECLEGKIAVGAVVMNRLNSGGYGRSITDVIKKPGQFASIDWISDGMLNSNPECMQAAKLALSGQDPTCGMLYFNSDKNSIKHIRPDRVYIGNHQFYKNFA